MAAPDFNPGVVMGHQGAGVGDCDGAPRTLTAIGADFGVCRERVRQVQALALHRLRPALSAFA